MADEKEIDVKRLFASASRTASADGDTQVNRFHKGVIVVIDSTVVTSGASLVYTIQGYDDLSGKWYTILASAAITDVGTVKLYVYPGSAVTSNLAANHSLPRKWRVIITAADAKAVTASVGATLLP